MNVNELNAKLQYVFEGLILSANQKKLLGECLKALVYGVDYAIDEATAECECLDKVTVAATANTLEAGEAATATVSSTGEGGKLTFTFGIPKGEKGDKGDTGEKGDTGATGAAGEDGEDGITPSISCTATVDGNTGTPSVNVSKSGTDAAPTFTFAFSNLKGEKGDKGDTGAQGEQGIQGETGEKGDKGDTGDAGADGADGVTPSITASATVDNTISDSPTCTVSKSGTDEAPIFTFEFSGIKGAKGDTGEAGTNGTNGADGADGSVVTFTQSLASGTVIGTLTIDGTQYTLYSTGNTTYDVATTSTNGLMSASDKTKLDSMSDTNLTVLTTNLPALASVTHVKDTNCWAYSNTQVSLQFDCVSSTGATSTVSNHLQPIPMATATNTGVVRLGSDTEQTVAANSVTSTASRTYAVQLNSDGQMVVNVPWSNTTYSVASTSANGLMSSTDKSKLDNIAEEATKVSFTQTLTEGTAIGTISINGVETILYCSNGTATTESAGLMSAEDKSTLDSLSSALQINSATGAQSLSYTATVETAGTVKQCAAVSPLETTADIETVITTLNTLIANLKEAGIMANS